MKNIFRRLTTDTDAQDLIEYALLSAAISIAAFTVLGAIGVDVRGTYGKVHVGISAANAT